MPDDPPASPADGAASASAGLDLSVLAEALSHEINNCIAVVKAQATLVEAQLKPGAGTDRIGKIQSAADRCSRLARAFAAVAARPAEVRAPFDLAAVALGALELAAYGAKRAGIETSFAAEPGLPRVVGDANAVGRSALAVLLVLQRSVAPSGTARLDVTLASRGGAVALTVETGIAAPSAAERTVLAAEIRAAAAPVAADIEDLAGGRLRIALALPLADAPPAPKPAPASARPFVLVVDPDPDLGETLADLFDVAGADAEAVTGAEAALARIAARPPDVLCCEARLAAAGQPSLRDRVLALRPDLAARFVVVAGGPVPPALTAPPNGPAPRILEKPLKLDDVRRLWRDLTDG